MRIPTGTYLKARFTQISSIEASVNPYSPYVIRFTLFYFISRPAFLFVFIHDIMRIVLG